jgi:hypothetical protein
MGQIRADLEMIVTERKSREGADILYRKGDQEADHENR